MRQRSRTIVIVEDNAEDRAVIRRYLTRSDDEADTVLEATTVDEAIELCRNRTPDCLLLDHELPGTTGLEFLHRVRDQDGMPPYPIIMLTGRGSEAVAVQALKQGVMDYIVKDEFDEAVLRRVIDDAIEKFVTRPHLERQRAEAERTHRDGQFFEPNRERLLLIVDDSPEDRFAICRQLSSSGGRVRCLEEETLAGGLAVCRSAGLDAVVLDYMLPDGDGVEFLNELTGGTGLTPFPVIVLTGHGDQMIAVRSLKAGASDYLIKGQFTSQALSDAVEQAIENVVIRRRQERQRIQVLERLEREARKRAEELAEQDRRKDQFLAMLAHELRNPLATLSYSLRLIDPQAAPDSAEALTVAERQIEHLTRLVDDLLDVSRISRGRIELKTQIVNLTEAVGRVVEACRSLAAARNHRLTLTLPDESIFIHADPTRLDQILSNLLQNAIKYTPDGGTVDITVEPQDGHAVVRVTDDGIGIEAHVLPHIFDLFIQADDSLDRSAGGLGIGLTLVRQLVEQHGGRVTAHSDGKDHGARFEVRVPITAQPEPSDTTPGNTSSWNTASGNTSAPRASAPGEAEAPLRILLVEDQEHLAKMFASLLTRRGHQVRLATNGRDALDAADEVPDVIFLDIGLPEMDGYEVAKQLRQRSDLNQTLLVAMTGYGREEDRQRALDAGFDEHMVKPVSLATLDDLLAAFRDRRRQTT